MFLKATAVATNKQAKNMKVGEGLLGGRCWRTGKYNGVDMIKVHCVRRGYVCKGIVKG